MSVALLRPRRTHCDVARLKRALVRELMHQ
jgi:hypothetical protein